MEGADADVQAALGSGLLSINNKGNELELTCTICLCRLKGAVPASQHLQGESHAKVHRRYSSGDNPAVAQHPVNLSPDLPEEIVVAIKAGYLRPFVKDGHEAFHCDVCQAPMTGTVPTIAHLCGDKHKRRFRSYNMNCHLDQITGIPVGLPLFDSKLSSVSASPEVELEEELERGTLEQMLVLGIQHFRCTVCEVTMTGWDPTRAHIKGKPHKKMCARKQQDPSFNNIPSNASFVSSNASLASSASCGNASSATSQMGPDSFNSKLLASLARLDMSNGTDVVSAALSSGVLVEVTSESFVCQVCSTKAVMCGRAPAKAHLGGAPHAKALVKAGQTTTPSLNPLCSTPNNSKSKSPSPDLDSVSSVSGPSTVLFKEDVPSETSNVGTIKEIHADNRGNHVSSALASGVLVLKPGLEDKYECTMCQKSMVGRIPAAAHLLGATHLKAERRENMHKSGSSSSSSGCNALLSDSSATQADGVANSSHVDDSELRCKVCCVFFQSKYELTRHLSCETHAVNQKKWEEKQKPVEVVIKSTSDILSAMPVDAGQLDMMAYVRCGEVEVLMRGERETYRCVPCQTELTSPSHLRAHLIGRAHDKVKKSLDPSKSIPAPAASFAATVTLPAPSSAATVTSLKQEPQISDDDSDSTASESNGQRIIVVEARETTSSSVEFQSFLAKIRRQMRKKTDLVK